MNAASFEGAHKEVIAGNKPPGIRIFGSAYKSGDSENKPPVIPLGDVIGSAYIRISSRN